jgi:hypothetical protein
MGEKPNLVPPTAAVPVPAGQSSTAPLCDPGLLASPAPHRVLSVGLHNGHQLPLKRASAAFWASGWSGHGADGPEAARAGTHTMKAERLRRVGDGVATRSSAGGDEGEVLPSAVRPCGRPPV